MNEAARRTVQHPNATAQIEDLLCGSPGGLVTVDKVAEATELPPNLVSTIMGRLARVGTRQGALSRPEGNRAGVFLWQPEGRTTPLAVVHRQRRQVPRSRPRRAVCPDSTLSSPTEHPQPSEDGSWVFFGETTGRPYRVVPL